MAWHEQTSFRFTLFKSTFFILSNLNLGFAFLSHIQIFFWIYIDMQKQNHLITKLQTAQRPAHATSAIKQNTHTFLSYGKLLRAENVSSLDELPSSISRSWLQSRAIIIHLFQILSLTDLLVFTQNVTFPITTEIRISPMGVWKVDVLLWRK